MVMVAGRRPPASMLSRVRRRGGALGEQRSPHQGPSCSMTLPFSFWEGSRVLRVTMRHVYLARVKSLLELIHHRDSIPSHHQKVQAWKLI